LAILTLINLFNYLDRFVVASLFESLKHSAFAPNDRQLGLLMSAFLIVYMLAAPIFGALGDRRSRPRLIAFGVACWSLATALSGLVGSYLALVVARASVGRGDAAYGTIAAVRLFSGQPPRSRDGDILLRHSGRVRAGVRDRRPDRCAFWLAHGILRRRHTRPPARGAVPSAAGSAAGPAGR
jgi:MFS family permease